MMTNSSEYVPCIALYARHFPRKFTQFVSLKYHNHSMRSTLVLSSLLQIRKWRHREVKKLIQGHSVAKWKSENLNPGHPSQTLHLNTLLRKKLMDADPPDPDSPLLLKSGLLQIQQSWGPISPLTAGQPPSLTHYGLKVKPLLFLKSQSLTSQIL